jgi:uncharacterized protein YndB with AHSA1/START domain
MKAYNWNSFTLRIDIRATVQDIYAAWTTKSGIESWFLRNAMYTHSNGLARTGQEPIQAGDRYAWHWHGYDDSVEEKNSILFANQQNQLQFGFSGGCIVTVTIKEEAGCTICELTQEMPQALEQEQQYFYIECGKGWTFYLANLKSILEGGIDLRNKNSALSKMVNA